MAINGVRKLSHLLCVQLQCPSSTCKAIRCWKWELSNFTSLQRVCYSKYAVLILNRPITQNENFIVEFWNSASLRVTVDGGTLKWDTFLSKLCEEKQKKLKLPDLITGDFDSITDQILEKYTKKGCKIVKTPNQNYTDFTKALMELNIYCLEQKLDINHVIAIGQSSGRIDQILGNIQTLFLAKEKHLLSPGTRLYLITDDAISWLLFPGDHIISIPEETIKHKKTWCSLIPVGETCEMITTSGLKWNLVDSTLRFGDLVSTSNAFDGSDTVKIKCSHTVLWSMRVPTLIG